MKLRSGKQTIQSSSVNEDNSVDILIKACEKYLIDDEYNTNKYKYIQTYKDIIHYNDFFISFLNSYQSTNSMFLLLKQEIEVLLQLTSKISSIYNISIHNLITSYSYNSLLDTLNKMKILNQYISTYILNKFY
jgi:hypothetical protein